MLYNSKLKNPEAERLRNEFLKLNMFQEAWTLAIKSGSTGFRKFELYDLANDPNQQADISSQKPDVLERLKRQIEEINASVLADAPTWGSKDKLSGEPSSDVEALLARIDSTELPEAYVPARHQAYVDKRIEGMNTKQRARLGHLWKEKQRLDPDMQNRGQSFVRILEFAAEDR